MLSFALIAAASGSCPVSNPNPDTMDQAFQQQWNSTKDDLDQLTANNRGAQIFRDYVETCEHEGNQAFSSNELDLESAPTIGGTTMFYNNKSAARHLDIFGGDLLVIPSQYFKVINDAQSELGDEEFNVLLRALVESGLTKAINDGEKGKNNWPTQNSVLMDSDGPGERGYIYMCLHLDPNVSVTWMHLHIFQDDAWRNADSLWNQTNTCTRIQKPQGRPWSTLLDRTKNNFAETVQNLADLLQCNMGDGHSGNVANFDAGSCPPNAAPSSEDSLEPEDHTVEPDESSGDASEPEENTVESSMNSSEPEENTVESSMNSSEAEENTVESSGDSSEALKSTQTKHLLSSWQIWKTASSIYVGKVGVVGSGVLGVRTSLHKGAWTDIMSKKSKISDSLQTELAPQTGQKIKG